MPPRWSIRLPDWIITRPDVPIEPDVPVPEWPLLEPLSRAADQPPGSGGYFFAFDGGGPVHG